MTEPIAEANLASQTIAVEHIRISSRRSFEEVRRRLEGTLPRLDASIIQLLRGGDQKGVTERAKAVDFRRARSWCLAPDCGQQA
jgi:hypothetical protein